MNLMCERKRGVLYGIPEGVGNFLKKVDAALPGAHTRQLYDELSWKEASILAQLRTGVCACGRATETTEQRALIIQRTDTPRGNLSFYLGGKAASDPNEWSPCMDAVWETIKFAIATGRLDAQIS
ncbi:hypothetical protein LZ32DRAFT_632939 [Colletotrichum eremochloae]|nr:hypothetical protein LZ32DRAFT_632939 [Colletotrichum eremochloae]